jgi:hypothetical protein
MGTISKTFYEFLGLCNVDGTHRIVMNGGSILFRNAVLKLSVTESRVLSNSP